MARPMMLCGEQAELEPREGAQDNAIDHVLQSPTCKRGR